MSKASVAVIQMAVDPASRQHNWQQAETLIRQAAAQGAQIILLPELFEWRYFCTEQDARYHALAEPLAGHPAVQHFSRLAAELQVVLPLSVFEAAGQARYNTVVIIDADGSVLGHYRKTHIPDGPGYSEKFYFNGGDTGFKVWHTRYARLGVGICWDQWFPEAARAMALLGAELLCYPTAIGSEPQDPTLDSRDHWQRTMQGHAAANLMPLFAANRIGSEQGRDLSQTYYGSSFITDGKGAVLHSAGRDEQAVLVQEFDLAELAAVRASWGVFRDRRPDAYAPLLTLDGHTPVPAAG